MYVSGLYWSKLLWMPAVSNQDDERDERDVHLGVLWIVLAHFVVRGHRYSPV